MLVQGLTPEGERIGQRIPFDLSFGYHADLSLQMVPDLPGVTRREITYEAIVGRSYPWSIASLVGNVNRTEFRGKAPGHILIRRVKTNLSIGQTEGRLTLWCLWRSVPWNADREMLEIDFHRLGITDQ